MSYTDSLEAALRFTMWNKCKFDVFEKDVREFVSVLGLNWEHITTLNSDDIHKHVNEALKSFGSQVFAWFELGCYTTLLSNMVADGQIRKIPGGLRGAINGYKKCLIKANFHDGTTRRILASLVNELDNASATTMKNNFEQIIDILREEALLQDTLLKQHNEIEKIIKDKIGNNPWLSGSFYLFAFVIISTVMLSFAKFISPFMVPVVIIGTILSITIVGALQLRNDERLKDESFTKIVELLLKHLMRIRRNKDD